jgi:hypothetical protein
LSLKIGNEKLLERKNSLKSSNEHLMEKKYFKFAREKLSYQ